MLTAIDLYEISLTATPMHPDAKVVSWKAAEQPPALTNDQWLEYEFAGMKAAWDDNAHLIATKASTPATKANRPIDRRHLRVLMTLGLLRQPGGFEGFGLVRVVAHPNHATRIQLVDDGEVQFDRYAASLARRPLMQQAHHSVIAGVDQPVELEFPSPGSPQSICA